MFSHFEASRSLSRHVQSVRIPIWGQKDVVRDGCVCCLSERGVERDPSHSVLQFAASEVLKAVFGTFNGVQGHLSPVLQLRGGRFGAVDRQVGLRW